MKKAEDALPNELLSFERERRLWTQEEVAERIGAPDANTVGRWERGIIRPSSYYRQQLSKLFGKSVRELGFVRKGDIPFWHVPYRQNVYFTGRDELLRQMYAHFSLQQRTGPTLPLALSGLGGIGKTQTALEYAYRYRHEYHTIIWVRAESSETLISDVVAFAGLLNLPEYQQQDQQSTADAVKSWLSAMTRWLLIFDNVDDLATLHDFLPSAPRGHLLLTTRMQMTGTDAETLALETMSPIKGAYFLLRRSKIIGFNAAFDEIGKDDHHLAVSISETLGGLPLALDQAGAYIEETACGLAGYLERYQQHREALLQRRGNADLHHPEPVATTWSLAFEKVSQSNANSIALLHFLAFFTPDAIPMEIITTGCALLKGSIAALAAHPLLLDEAIRDLRHFSLIQRAATDNTLLLHRLVQAMLLDTMAPQEQYEWAEMVVRALCVVFPSGEFRTWQQCERLLSQALTGVALVSQWSIIAPEATRLTHRIANYLRNRGRFTHAERLYQQALAQYETTGRFEPGEVASCLYQMGDLYLTLKDFDKTFAFFQRALAIQEQAPGDLRPDLARTLDTIGEAYYYLEDYAQAEDYFRRALVIRQDIFGSDHPDTAESLNNLGILLLKSLRKYDEAEIVFQQVLAIMTKHRGPDHMDVGICMLNLATTYREQGKYKLGKQWYLRTIELWRRVLGEEDTDVAFALRALAKLYALEGSEQAEATYLQALAIYEKARGPGHRVTLEIKQELEELRQATFGHVASIVRTDK